VYYSASLADRPSPDSQPQPNWKGENLLISFRNSERKQGAREAERNCQTTIFPQPVDHDYGDPTP
jgi:hypothetical protein